MFVAAHGWDVTGAHAAGLHTTWISRGEAPTPGPEACNHAFRILSPRFEVAGSNGRGTAEASRFGSLV